MWNPYTEEHEEFRKLVRRFAETEIAPYADKQIAAFCPPG